MPVSGRATTSKLSFGGGEPLVVNWRGEQFNLEVAHRTERRLKASKKRLKEKHDLTKREVIIVGYRGEKSKNGNIGGVYIREGAKKAASNHGLFGLGKAEDSDDGGLLDLVNF